MSTRRNFFKKLGLLGAVTIVAPKLLAETKDNSWTLDDNGNKFRNNTLVNGKVEKYDYSTQYLDYDISGEFDGKIINISAGEENITREYDKILISDKESEQFFIVTKSRGGYLEVVCFNALMTIKKGKVYAMICSREFKHV